jgi:hypothetical protein
MLPLGGAFFLYFTQATSKKDFLMAAALATLARPVRRKAPSLRRPIPVTERLDGYEPNEKTKQILHETDAGIGVKKFSSVAALMQELRS